MKFASLRRGLDKLAKPFFSRFRSELRTASLDDFVPYASLRLPPHRLRFCTHHWQDDKYYVLSARNEVSRLIELASLNPRSSLLNLGSGQARLAIGLLAHNLKVQYYYGMDVSRHSIDWCKRNIHRFHSHLNFIHFDIHNARYNPQGVLLSHPLQLPFQSAAFDVIYLYSVFTHMRSPDIHFLLWEIQRILRNEGVAFSPPM